MRNWNRFLKNDSNYESLFQYLATSAIQSDISEGHQLVITCDHEEADTLMIFHTESANSVTLLSVDTDVLVLAVASPTRYGGKDILVHFGTG